MGVHTQKTLLVDNESACRPTHPGMYSVRLSVRLTAQTISVAWSYGGPSSNFCLLSLSFYVS